MAKRKIIWSSKARIKLYEILEYFIDRNKSPAYSNQLLARFYKELKLLNKYPYLGLKTDLDSVRGLIIQDYILFYEVTETYIIVHTIWDSRQNIENLKIK